jgi:peptidoglycan/xylan/chitin deacetylase (PgdA/CDA1 family)
MLALIKKNIRALVARHQALILTYHSIVPEPLPFPVGQHLAVAAFEKQMALLAEHFHCVSLSALVNNIEQGRIKPYTVALTFDDGFYNNFSVACPILHRYRLPAAFFLTAGYIGTDKLLWPETLACALAATEMHEISIGDRRFRLSSAAEKSAAYQALTRDFKGCAPQEAAERVERILRETNLAPNDLQASLLYKQFRMLGWNEVEQMAASDLVEIGSHTLLHPRLSRISHDDARAEIINSKHLLEQHVGPVRFFAYPYGGRPGDFNEEHRAMATDAGYEAIFTAIHGTVTPDSDRYDLPRVSVSANTSYEEFDYLLHGGAAMMARDSAH